MTTTTAAKFYSVTTFGPSRGATGKAYRSYTAAVRAARTAIRAGATTARVGEHTSVAAARAADISTVVPVWQS